MDGSTGTKLATTWIFDLDGTLVVHNGYLNGKDILLPGTKEFFKLISEDDFVLITTARSSEFADMTESFLKENDIRFDRIIYNLPKGKRVLMNDKKPDGTLTAFCYNLERDKGIYEYIR